MAYRRLFNGNDLHRVFANRLDDCYKEIANYDSNYILNTSQDTLVEYLYDKFQIEPLVVHPDETTMETQDEWESFNNRYGEISKRNITVFYFYVPFSGDKGLFDCRPTTSSSPSPLADIQISEVVFKYTHPSTGQQGKETEIAASIRKQHDQELKSLVSHVNWIQKDIENFNTDTKQRIIDFIGQRRKKFLNDKGITESLGFPLRRRSNMPETYRAPSIKRKIHPKPASNISGYQPEPALDIDEYDHILSIIQSMVQVIERSPSAFASMEEEDLRQHFLVQLNGHYEGQATGETFNGEGKTDILIREKDKNIFIAECKFWKGPKILTETIDQILGYISWRDTKTAIILFNRNKDFSAVLDKITPNVEAHPNHRKTLEWGLETQFRYKFHHKDDANRELYLSVLIFEVPK